VANWGNLVYRTLTVAHRAFGQVPQPGERTAVDEELLAAVEAGFAVVGALIEATRFKAALQEVLRLSALANKYVNDQEPWRLVKSDRGRAAMVLFTALRVVDSLKTLFTPFLPFSSQKLHELLGYKGHLAGPLVFQEVAEPDGVPYRVLTGDYASWVGRWEPSRLAPGQTLLPPVPLFRKIDESVVDEELARLKSAQA
jgi:methionyl-tRNA synthetase